MSKIRSVRQRTDAPRQDEGPGTGAALLAGAVLGLATDAVALALPRQQARLLSAATLAAAAGYTSDSRWPTAAGPPCSCRPASCPGSRRWPPWPSSATRRACSVPAGWRTLPGTPCTTEAAGPPGYGPGTRRSASATTWPSLRRCSPASSSRGPARPALRRLGSRSRPGRLGPDSSPEDGTTEPPMSAQNGQ